MEPGINGYQTLAEIKKFRPEQKAVIVSGFSDSEAVKAALRLGAADFIKKPYDLAHLSRTVSRALEKSC